MRFDLITIFPDFFSGPLEHGIVRRAREASIVEVHVRDLRDWAHDRHRTVDDRPFGGGEGMVLKPEPLFEAVESLLGGAEGRPEASGRYAPTTAIVLLSASGKLFQQETARRFAGLDRIVLLCGRYEGVDERVAEHLATDELSIGDFVLSGGELPAALVLDAVTRLLPGALGNEASSVYESFSGTPATSAQRPMTCEPPGPDAVTAVGLTRHSPVPLAPSAAEGSGAEGPLACPERSRRATRHYLLDHPHYTRPADFRGWLVPEVLLSGNHAEIRLWRRKMALAKTLRNRPELLAGAALSDEDARLLADLRSGHSTL